MTASRDDQGIEEATLAAWVTLSLRVILGVWFIYSGGTKLFGSGLEVFARDLGNYRLLPEAWISPIAYVVPWTELIAGLFLMMGMFRRGAILVIFGLVIGFIVFISWAWQQQLDISCGCQGDGEPIRYWFKAVELPGYLLMLVWLWWRDDLNPFGSAEKKENMA